MTKMVPEEFKIRVKQHLEAAHKNYLGMEKKKKKSAGPDRIRTGDLLFTRQAL